MDPTTFLALAAACAPQVDTLTARALVQVESSFNPWAIGVVGGSLLRQPRHRAEAQATVAQLQTDGWDYSVGLAQINQRNFPRLGLTPSTAFEPCRNLQAMQAVLLDCQQRLDRPNQSRQTTLRQTLSCYYSGNPRTGFEHGYVQRVVDAARHRRGAPP
ncbi:MAG: lytic transglycosylase domain-containing protein [Burkholderiaceae bacterium]|nr:lytic transglycosylase domain-containing protein [Burkholderiaceae bacterium]